PVDEYDGMVATVMSAEGAATFEQLIRRDQLQEFASERQARILKAALELPAYEYVRVGTARQMLRTTFGRLFRSCDLIVAPAQTRTAPPLAQLGEDMTRRPSVGSRPRSQLTAAANLAGLPAVVVPCGLGTDGLPVALQ